MTEKTAVRPSAKSVQAKKKALLAEVVHRLALRLLAAVGRPLSDCSDSNRRRSPGWQESASQIASSVEKRIARALPVFKIERLASAIPIRSASSVSVIRRS